MIKTDDELKSHFKNNSLKLNKGSSIIFHENLALGNNIEFFGKNIFGKNNLIQTGSIIDNIHLGNSNKIRQFSSIENSTFKNKNLIGPYAFIREGTLVQNDCILGAFLEVTRSKIKDGVKISHRAFIGDTVIGSNSIIGSSVVFCNYNHKTKKKEKSSIGKNCLIGSLSSIIHPIFIGNNVIVGAGSIVNKDIKSGSKIIIKR